MKHWKRISNASLNQKDTLPHHVYACLYNIFQDHILFTISPTFYEQLFLPIFFCQKLQSQTVKREKLQKTLSRKLLLKLSIVLTTDWLPLRNSVQCKKFLHKLNVSRVFVMLFNFSFQWSKSLRSSLETNYSVHKRHISVHLILS
jgi:hypothetical protein